MTDTRPIDVWMLLIELGILALMIGGIAWGVPAWLERRREEKALQNKLANLPPEVAEGLKGLVLQGIGLNEHSATILSHFPTPIVERDYTMGWRVLREHKKSVEKWTASKRTP
jgi:hypothetical protein